MEITTETLKQLGSDDQAEAHKTYMALLTTVREATKPGQQADRKQLAAQLAAELNATNPGGKDDKGKDKPPVSRYSDRVRNRIAELLGHVAGAEETPALAAIIKDWDLRETVRCALERVSADEATDALIAALDEAGPEFRAGVVGSLARRGGAKVSAALQPLVNDIDAPVRMAAIDALGSIPLATNDDVLAPLVKDPCPKCRRAVTQARVHLADLLGKAGDKATAKRIFQAVKKGDADAAQKKAAEIGLKSL